MKKYEIHKAMYYYGLVLRTLDVIFSSKRKYNKLWIQPNQGFDIYRSNGGSISQMENGARLSGLGDDDSLQITCSGLLLKPVGWKDGYSVSIGHFSEKGKEVRIKFYLRHPGITSLGWHFSMIISPTRIIIRPMLDLPRTAPESKEFLYLFGDKKHIII